MARTSRSKSADPDVTAEDRGEAAKALSGVGIEVYDENGQYQDFGKTLDELAAKWDTLTDAQRANVAEGMAGVRNINILTNLVETWQEAQGLAQEVEKDPNYYLEVQDKWMESTQAKLNTLRASMQEFWNSVLDTGVINVGIEILTGIVNVGQSILSIFGSIRDTIGGTTGSIVSLGVALATVAATVKTIQGVKLGGTILGSLAATGKGAVSGIGGIFGAIGTLFSSSGRSGLMDGANAMNQLVRSGEKFSDVMATRDGGIAGLAQGFGALAGKIGVSTTALLGFVGVVGGIAAFIGIFNALTDSTEETANKVTELNEKYRETQNELKSQRETIDSVGLEWETLSKGVDKFGNNISLTTDEFSRYNELTNQLAEQFPDLVSGYTSTGDAVINLTNGMKGLNDEYERQVVLAAKERLEEDAGTYQENFNNVTGNKSWNTAMVDNWKDSFQSAQIGNSIDYEWGKEILSNIQNMTAEQVAQYVTDLDKTIREGQGTSKDIQERSFLKDTIGIKGFNLEDADSMEEWQDQWVSIKGEVDSMLSEVNATIDSATNDMQSLMTDYWNTLILGDGQYSEIDDKLKQQISSMLSNTGTDLIERLKEEGSNYEGYVNDLATKITGSFEARSLLDEIYSLNGDSSIEDIKKVVTDDIAELSEILDQSEDELKIQFDLEDEANLVKRYDEVVGNAVKKIESDNKKRFSTSAKGIAESVDKGYTDGIISGLESQKEKLEEAYNKVINGNIDYSKRPVVSAEDMWGKGWDEEHQDLAGDPTITTYTQGYFGKDFDDVLNKNKELYLEITPILDTGEVLTPEELDEYVNNLFKQEDVLEADKVVNGGKGLIVSSFDNPTDEALDKYQEKLGGIKDEHAELLTTIENIKKAQAEGGDSAVSDYLTEIMPDLEDGTFLKNVLKYSKKINKDYKDLNKSNKSINKSYDEQEDLQDKIRDYIEDNNINTEEQLDLLNKCVQETDSWAEATRQFELQDLNLEEYDNVIEQLEANLETVKTTIENINEAMDQSHESTGLTGEQIDNIVNAFSGLDGYDYDKLFESTAAGVHLNVKELEMLNGEYEKAEKKKYTDTLSELEQKYANLCIRIEEATTATKRNELVTQRNQVEEKIAQVQELASRYEGLTNSVTKFQQAMEGGEEGDTYDYIAENLEEVERLYNEGLTGTNKFRSAVQMMTNEDMDGASNEEYIEMYEKMKSLFTSLFTEDSANGAKNFLEQLTNITNESGQALASYDNLNDRWKINSADTATIAKELGISEGAIAEIFKKLSDFGFDIDFTEETDHLKKMREEAEKANQTFNNFSKIKGFEDFKFDLTITDPDALREQIDVAEELRKVLVNTYDAGSKEVEAFDAQLDYLKATAGQTVDALDFSINYNDNKDEIDSLKKKLQELENYEDLKFNFDTTSVTNVENQLGKVVNKLKDVTGEDGRINLEAEGAAELMDLFIALINKENELSRPAVVKLDINDFSGDYQTVMQLIQNYQAAVEEANTAEWLATVDVQYQQDAEDAKKKVEETVAAINNSEGATAEILTKLNLEPGSLTQENLDTTLSGLDSNIMINAGFQLTEQAQAAMGGATKDDTKTIKADTSQAETQLANLEEKITTPKYKDVNIVPKTAEFNTTMNQLLADRRMNVYVDYRNGVGNVGGASTGAKANGTAHVSGTARANGTSGDWGLPKDETALVGELGSELVVNPDDGTWNLVGENGAEFADLKKNSIIFNHKQTEELFKNGYVTSNGGRGKAFINGTIGKLNSLFKVGKGSAYAGGYSGGGSFGYSGSGKDMWANNNDKSKSKSSKSDEPKEEDFDWIEVAIDRIERAISKLETTANSAYKSLTGRNSDLSKQFSKVTEEINLQQKAYNAYMKEANAVGLSSTYKKKVQNGTMNIETITNEDLASKIKEYQDLYEKALDAQEAVLDLKETLGDIEQAKFDNVVSQYDAQLNEIQSRIDSIETGLDMVEAKGNLASKNYFQTLMDIEQENINKLSQEYDALQKAFNEAMNSGAIQKNSEAYYDMQEQIRDVGAAWQEAKLSLQEYQNQMRENDWEIFDKYQEYISELTNESDFIRELLSITDNNLFDEDTGLLSNAGQAVGGLHAVDYNVYMAQADEYRKKVEELNAEIAKDPANTTLIDKRNEYLEQQREAILNAQDEKKAVQDLIGDSYERMLDILQELIDKRKEALQAEKDLYDYEKNVEEQTKNITDIQKQLTAIQGDTSEEAMSKRQQLQSQLEEAQSDLQDTEYDQWLSDQEKLLDDYYSEVEEYLNQRLDDINGLMTEMIDSTNANSETINQTIQEVTNGANGVGYQITSSMNSIWSNTSSGLGKVVSDYSNNFSSIMTTTNSYVKSIYDLINKSVNKSTSDKKTNTSTKPSGSGSSGNKGSGSSSSSSSNKGSSSSSSSSYGKGIFKYKKDNFPKNKLNVNTSIIDRLKYFNFDPSWNSVKGYYQKLGGKGTYTGSYSQNVWLIKKMKEMGYSTGGQLKKMVKASGEDGIFFGRTGEEVLSLDKLSVADHMTTQLIDFAKYMSVPNSNGGINSNAEINLNITLPNVKDEKTFLDAIKTNRKIQEALADVTIGRAMGKNSLNVNRHK